MRVCLFKNNNLTRVLGKSHALSRRKCSALIFFKSGLKQSSHPDLMKQAPTGTHWGWGEAPAHLHVSFQLEIILALQSAEARRRNEPWRCFKGVRDREKKACDDRWGGWKFNWRSAKVSETKDGEGRWLDGEGLGRRQGAALHNQEVDTQDNQTYVLGIGAGNKLLCCTQWRRGQMEFTSSQCLSPQAGRLLEDQRHEVMPSRLCWNEIA